jgi:hypothetical protein
VWVAQRNNSGRYSSKKNYPDFPDIAGGHNYVAEQQADFASQGHPAQIACASLPKLF